MDCSPPGFSVHGVFQARILGCHSPGKSGLPFLSSRNLPDPGIEPGSPALQANSLSSESAGEPVLTGILHHFLVSLKEQHYETHLDNCRYIVRFICLLCTRDSDSQLLYILGGLRDVCVRHGSKEYNLAL